MTYTLRPAARTEAKPLIGLHAESGAGKTYSALLLARGFVGTEGRICMIETESGRGEAYSSPEEYPELAGTGPSNYEVIPLRDNFSPQAYGEAITAAEQAGVDALIIDSASHEWEGAGGVLSMAAENQASGKKGVLVWQQPKMQHQRHFMLRFMQTPIPLVILCMRSKYPMKEMPKRNGQGKEWVRSEALEPKQADDILFEMFVHGWISQGDHVFHVGRCTAKALGPVFGGDRPLSLDTGRKLAEWAKGNAPQQSAPAAAATTPADPLAEAKAIAEQGSVKFRDWWTSRTKTQNAPLHDHLDELKKVATDADARIAAEGTDDDPFDTETPAGGAEGGGPDDRPSEVDGAPASPAQEAA